MAKKTETSDGDATWTVGRASPALFIMCLPAVACDVEPPPRPSRVRKKRKLRTKKRAA